jgi:hypothetical protein
MMREESTPTSSGVGTWTVGLYILTMIGARVLDVRVGDSDLAAPAPGAVLFLLFLGVGWSVDGATDRDAEPSAKRFTVLLGLALAALAIAIFVALIVGGSAGYVGMGAAIVVCLVLGYFQRKFKG